MNKFLSNLKMSIALFLNRIGLKSSHAIKICGASKSTFYRHKVND